MRRLILFLILLSVQAFGQECPQWLGEKNLPVCPNGPIVSENYPTAFVVVSDSSQVGRSKERVSGAQFTTDVVMKTLKAGAPNPPKVLVVSNDQATFDKISAAILALHLSKADEDKMFKQVVVIPGESFTWQQDFYQNFLDKKTGMPELRPFAPYVFDKDRGPVTAQSFLSISDGMAACGVKQGSIIPPSSYREKAIGGQMGGNIEALPGGICVLGSDGFTAEEWARHAKEMCGDDPQNILKAPTGFLMVGHTDEIFKVIKNPSKPAPCDFSVAVASPKKAIELLRKNEKQDFYETKNKSNLRTAGSFHEFCDRYNKAVADRASNGKKSKGQAFNLIFGRAYAGAAEANSKFVFEPIPDPKDMPKNDKEYKRWLAQIAKYRQKQVPLKDSEYKTCENISNGDFLWFMQNDPEVKNYVTEVQNQMDQLKIDIKAKLKNKLPACEPDIIDVPELFWGANSFRDKGKAKLPNGFGQSFQPGPTNSISVGDTNIIPEPYNASFKAYLETEYHKRGIKTDYIDTWNYAHRGEGNLHCSTQTLHVCKPRSTK